MPLPVPSPRGLAKRGNARPHDPLGHGLVEGYREHDRVREGVGYLPCIKQCRHESFAAHAVHALAEVEHEVPRPPFGEGGDEAAEVADTVRRIPFLADGLLDRVDGLVTVELGGFLLRESLGEVFRAQVVCQSHGDLLHGRKTIRLPHALSSGTEHGKCVE
jgi:hypothetical protein